MSHNIVSLCNFSKKETYINNNAVLLKQKRYITLSIHNFVYATNGFLS